MNPYAHRQKPFTIEPKEEIADRFERILSMYAKDRTTIQDRREMLRVKLKSLAEETRIIRREERRTHGALREELYLHRTRAVGVEARLTHLAYGFIRGRTYEQMEATTKSPLTPASWERVRAMLKKYGPAGLFEPEVMKKAA